MKSYLYLPVSCSGASDADDTYLCGTQTEQFVQTEVSNARIHYPLASDGEAEFVDPSDTTPPASIFVFSPPLLRFLPHPQENRRTHHPA